MSLALLALFLLWHYLTIKLYVGLKENTPSRTKSDQSLTLFPPRCQKPIMEEEEMVLETEANHDSEKDLESETKQDYGAICAKVGDKQRIFLWQLPGELLLVILDHILEADDLVSLFCLRRVSARFRRLIYAKPFWSKIHSGVDEWEWPRESPVWLLPEKQLFELRHLLQRDGLCKDCIRYAHDESGQYPAWRGGLEKLTAFDMDSRRCSFLWPKSISGTGTAYCHGCETDNYLLEFPTPPAKSSAVLLQQGDLAEEERVCIGRQGAVKLCEHVSIDWADVEAFLSASCQNLKYQKADGSAIPRNQQWPRWLHDSVLAECRHPSHATRCFQQQDVSSIHATSARWPRAVLRYECWMDDAKDDEVGGLELHLEWSAHSGIEAFRGNNDSYDDGRRTHDDFVPCEFTCTHSQMATLAEVAAVIQRVRQQGRVTAYLLAKRGAITRNYPEMIFLGPAGRLNSQGKSAVAAAASDDDDMEPATSTCLCGQDWESTDTCMSGYYNRGEDGRLVWMSTHEVTSHDVGRHRKLSRPAYCLVIDYERSFDLIRFRTSQGSALDVLKLAAATAESKRASEGGGKGGGPVNIKLRPSHAWLHAMDPDSYTRPTSWSNSKMLPICLDPGCMNYCWREKDYYLHH